MILPKTSMRKLLIPSGQILFRGSPNQLKAYVKNMGGTLYGERQFSCRFTWPNGGNFFIRILGVRNIYFDFRCVYRRVGTQTEISYEGHPHFSCYLMLFIPMLFIIAVLFPYTGGESIPASEYLLFPFFGVCYLLFFIARNRCTQQFLHAFGRDRVS